MRLWSLHPQYLDAKGLVALWREGLLAKHVIEGKTKGYKHHPQLIRFNNTNTPLGFIQQYLTIVYNEAVSRDYQFDGNKIIITPITTQLTVTINQLAYERKHLLQKLKIRDAEKHKLFKKIQNMDPHPLFKIIKGEIESWEILDN